MPSSTFYNEVLTDHNLYPAHKKPLPGANMTGYVVVGIVAGQLGKKVDPIKAMLYCLPMVIALTGIAIFFLY